MRVDVEESEPARPAPARSPVEVALALLRFVGPGRLAAGVAGAAIVLVAGAWLLRPSSPPVEASLPFAAPVTASPGDEQQPTATSPDRGTIVVHVAGAVERPGLVELPADARVADALDAAGGPAPGHDASALNLAQRVADGQRVRVPFEGEPAPPGGWADAALPAEDGAHRLVDVNRASLDELQALPGVGPATAAAIVAHRERIGPFRHVDDLLDVRGIGPAKLDAIRDLVTV